MSGFEDYDQHDATGLAELVRRGETSAAELVDAAIERIEARDPALNAVVHRSFERARAEAQAPDALPDGAFRGVPFLLKDLKAFDAGQPSTNGSRLFAERRATHDDELVRRFKRAGLIICGRTNTPELGILGVTEPELHGPTRNPWDLERTPGGSSGGSGAAVAAGMVPAAHASDGGGSIRIPASNCGLVGLKPTRHRVPLMAPTGSWGGLAGAHVVTRTVRDSAGLLDCLHGPKRGIGEHLPPPEQPFAAALERPPERLRVALCTRALLGRDTDPACVHAAEAAAKLCASLGHSVEEAMPEFDRAALTRAYLTMVVSGTAAAVRSYEAERGRKARAGELEAKTWLLKIIGESLSAGEYIEQLELIQTASVKIAEFFADYDVLITSTLAQPPLKVGEITNTALERNAARVFRTMPVKRVMLALLDDLAEDPLAATPNTQLFNMTGQPAISLPLHWDDAGLPIGVQFAGRLGEEELLLRLARQLEQAKPWAGRRPPTG
ncbi:6-aminohexanoate-cyclic-dimer hydrolase [Enhygromyxa salina]|uniref:6-aminohexanoate-cyclic-dimer hydrolase n=1 Tax=Enhygromyxa salina TaxID=215803 RepID=A0A2S9XAY4_9BACT|nr:amidase family protein [Enhygromyxa salina]PRP90015.1 6-aminohexanoate-cyclic-dimer hydrolase [Enhygromyxa salina]